MGIKVDNRDGKTPIIKGEYHIIKRLLINQNRNCTEY